MSYSLFFRDEYVYFQMPTVRLIPGIFSHIILLLLSVAGIYFSVIVFRTFIKREKKVRLRSFLFALPILIFYSVSMVIMIIKMILWKDL